MDGRSWSRAVLHERRDSQRRRSLSQKFVAWQFVNDEVHQCAYPRGRPSTGGLALALASDLAHERASCAQPAAVVALSPVTDLTLSGASWTSRAEADPYFTISQAREQADAYLAGRDASDAQASPLFARLAGLHPLRIHVGDDEVLLDDSLRYAERAKATGVDAHVHVWQGLPHVFLSSVGRLVAADQALADVGAFIADRLR